MLEASNWRFDGHTKERLLLIAIQAGTVFFQIDSVDTLARRFARDYSKRRRLPGGSNQTGIPVISLGTDCDINKIVIRFVNDSALSGIKFMLEELMKAYQAGKTAGVLAGRNKRKKLKRKKKK